MPFELIHIIVMLRWANLSNEPVYWPLRNCTIKTTGRVHADHISIGTGKKQFEQLMEIKRSITRFDR